MNHNQILQQMLSDDKVTNYFGLKTNQVAEKLELKTAHLSQP